MPRYAVVTPDTMDIFDTISEVVHPHPWDSNTDRRALRVAEPGDNFEWPGDMLIFVLKDKT